MTADHLPKASRLSSPQVISCVGLIIALCLGKLGLGRYSFVDEGLERIVLGLCCCLLASLVFIVAAGPKNRGRVIWVCLLTPFAFLFALGGCGSLLNINEYPPSVEKTILVGDVRVSQISNYDVTYYELCRNNISLELERPVFGGLLQETNLLLDIRPAEKADFEIIDNGKKIRFVSPALRGRKEIVRTYSTDWYAPSNKRFERIGITPTELNATR